jgi:hypothetical protein
LIATGLVALILAGLLVTANSALDDRVEKSLGQRRVLRKDLANLDKKKINDQVVEAERKRVASAQDVQRRIVSESQAWNKGTFTVLSTTLLDEQGKERTIQAFPMDRKLYNQYSPQLQFNLTKSYLAELEAMVPALKPATAGTDLQVQTETVFRKKKLSHTEEFLHVSEDNPILNQRAVELARQAVRVGSAQDKLIYIGPESLDVVFPQPANDPSDERLWDAQINLWVTSEILGAIGSFNEEIVAEIQQARPDEPVSVGISGVKRLMRLSVVVPGGAGGTALAGAASRALTKRESTQLYDPVYYEFTVIMPLRYVGRFQKELMNRNYHTILGLQMAPMVQGPQDLYYYGPEAVMRVTFTGELLLLTAWARGTWDPAADAWSTEYPPLMPKAILAKLPAGALRPEDKNR